MTLQGFSVKLWFTEIMKLYRTMNTGENMADIIS